MAEPASVRRTQTRSRLERAVHGHPLWSHPLLSALRQAEAAPGVLRALVVEELAVRQQLSGYLGSLVGMCPSDEARIRVARRLWLELGEGLVEQSSRSELVALARSLGLSSRQLRGPRQPETRELLERLARTTPVGFEAGLGVVCYGCDLVDERLEIELNQALIRSSRWAQPARRYFELRTRIRERTRDLSSLLDDSLCNRLVEDDVESTLLAFLDARARFCDGVSRAARARGRASYQVPTSGTRSN